MFASFERGNIYDSEIMVDIALDSEISKTRVKEVRLVYGRYGMLFLLDSAFADIYDPQLCQAFTKRGKQIKSSCKVYRSEDKRRIYIYVLGGEGANRYDVTWVMQDQKYYTRVVDTV